MFFFKPKSKWTPKEIKGDADIQWRDKSKNDERDKQTAAGPVNGSKSTTPFLNPESATANADTQNIRDNFPADEQKIIDDYLKDRDQLFNDLDYIDDELDKRLQDLQIPYDSKKFPLLAAAHKCPYCGNAAAADIITYDDIKKKRDGERNLQAAVSNVAVPGNYGSMSTEDVASHQEQMFSMLVKEMLDAVWRQILIWVLELLLGILSPLKKVPFAGAIPNALEQWINSLRKRPPSSGEKAMRDKSESSLYGDSNAGDDGSSYGQKNSDVEEYYRTIDAVGKMASLGGIYRVCIQHYQDFHRQTGNLIQGKKEEIYLNMKDTNYIVRKNASKVDQLSATSIPNGWEYNPDPTTAGLKYKNPVSESYLQARADGKGVMPSLLIAGQNGTHAVIKSANEQWVRNVKNTLTAWWESPDTLCCILRNLLGIGNMKVDVTGGRTILLIIRSILEFYRNFISFNLKDSIADLFNLIVGIINEVFTKLIGGLATFLQSQLNRLISQVDMTKILKIDTKCLPWNDLVLTFGVYLKNFIEEFGSMLLDFITNANMINVRAGKVAKECETALKIDNWLALIDSILKFLRIWQFCVDTNKDPNNYLRTQESRDHFASLGGSVLPEESIDKILQNLQNSPTIYNDGINGLRGSGSSLNKTQTNTPGNLTGPGKDLSDVVSRFPETESQVDSGNTSRYERVDKPWTIDNAGLKILLTNYIGLSEPDANVVLSDSGDCACDNALTDDELAVIREALSKRSNNG